MLNVLMLPGNVSEGGEHMNRCENYTLNCEAYDCCECDNFDWDGTGEEPGEENE